jgi:hypothetical protein
MNVMCGIDEGLFISPFQGFVSIYLYPGFHPGLSHFAPLGQLNTKDDPVISAIRWGRQVTVYWQDKVVEGSNIKLYVFFVESYFKSILAH